MAIMKYHDSHEQFFNKRCLSCTIRSDNCHLVSSTNTKTFCFPQYPSFNCARDIFTTYYSSIFTLSKFTKSILSGGSSFLFSTLSSFSSLVSRDFIVFRNFFCLPAKYGFVPFILLSDELKFFGF